MCDKAVDYCVAALKFVPDWFVTSKMTKELFTASYADDTNISTNVGFSFNKIGILNIDLHNINLDTTFDEDDPNTIILIRLLAWHMKFEKRKAFKKELHE